MKFKTIGLREIEIDQSLVDQQSEPFQLPSSKNSCGQTRRAKLFYLSDRGRVDRSVPEELRGLWKRHARLRSRNRSSIPVIVFSAERCTRQRRHLFKVIAKSKRPLILLSQGGGDPEQVDEICRPACYISYHLGGNVILFSYSREMNPTQIIVFRYLLTHWDQVPFNALDWLEGLQKLE